MTKLGVVRLSAIRLSISSKRKNRPSSISSGANLMPLCSATHRNVCTNSRSTSLSKTYLYNSSGLSAQKPSSSNVSLLTSSTCHPKFVGKERCNALMTFHEHCFADCLLVLRKVYLYCYDCLCERQHFVDAHPDL